MALQHNPIVMLGLEVLEGGLSLDQATERVASNEFLRTIEDEHLKEIVTLVDVIKEQHLEHSFLYSTLNKTCAEAKGIDENILGSIYVIHGVILFKKGDFSEALKVIGLAKDIYSKKGSMDAVITCNFLIANICSNTRCYNEAIKLYRSVQKSFKKVGAKKEDIAGCYLNLSLVYNKIGKYNRALKLCESAREIFDQINIKSEVASCDLALGTIYEKVENYEQARKYYETARAYYESNGLKQSEALCDYNLADMNRKYGHYDKALKLYKSAKNTFTDQGMDYYGAHCDQGMATIFMHFKDYEKMFDLDSSAKKVFQKKRMAQCVAECKMGMAIWYRHIKSYDRALKLLESAKKIFMGKNIEAFVAGCHIGIGNIFAQTEKFDQALENYEEAGKIFLKKKQKQQVALCDMNMALVYRLIGENYRALALLRRVLKSHGHLIEFRHKCLIEMGRNYKDMAKVKISRKYYEKAIRLVENVWLGLNEETLQRLFLNYSAKVYYEIMQLCFEQKDYKNAFKYLEQMKSRYLSEKISSHDLVKRNDIMQVNENWNREDRFGGYLDSDVLSWNNCIGYKDFRSSAEITKGNKITNELKEVQSTLRQKLLSGIEYSDARDVIEDSVLVELFPMGGGTAVFVVKRDLDVNEGTLFIEKYNDRNLFDHVYDFKVINMSVVNSGNHQQKATAMKKWENYLDQILEELYEKIFLKIKPYLYGSDKIIIVPYGGFHHLPLHAMYYGENGGKHYVIDDHIVFYSPSAKIYRECLKRNRSRMKNLVVMVSNPVGTEKLSFSAEEAKEICRLFDGSRLKDEITAEEFICVSKKANILHYSGHASYDGLLLHSDQDKGRMQEFSLKEMFERLDLPEAYLVTLSACETGESQWKPVDEYFGPVGAFLYAGAPTVISSLWSVQDHSTSLLMRKIYEFIKKGNGRAESLIKAQRWLKDKNNWQEQLKMLSLDLDDRQGGSPFDFTRPYHWAGFICSGVN